MSKPAKETIVLNEGARALAKARAASLTAKRRSEIASMGGKARWKKAKKDGR